MTTIERPQLKPHIYTESDHILNELKTEFESLKSKVQTLEDEQKKSQEILGQVEKNNREILDQVIFQRHITNEVIHEYEKEKAVTKENFEMLADVMHRLKTPVSSVVENLNEIVSEINDRETRESLEDCMNTASKVLDSFNEAEDFCEVASKRGQYESEWIESKQYFKNLVKSLKADNILGESFQYRLFIEKNLPDKNLIKKKVLDRVIKDLVIEMRKYLKPTQVNFLVSVRPSDVIYDQETKELMISFDADQPSSLVWEDKFIDMLRINQEQLVDTGLGFVQVRDRLQKVGGRLEFLHKENRVSGFKVILSCVE